MSANQVVSKQAILLSFLRHKIEAGLMADVHMITLHHVCGATFAIWPAR